MDCWGKAYPATGNLLLSAQFVSSSSGEVRHLPHLAPGRRLPLHRVAAERNEKLRRRENVVR